MVDRVVGELMDSNPGPQDCMHRWIRWAMAASVKGIFVSDLSITSVWRENGLKTFATRLVAFLLQRTLTYLLHKGKYHCAADFKFY